MIDLLPSGLWPVMLAPFGPDKGLDPAGIDALTDWYIGHGAAGLFAVCLSTEMYELTAEERLLMARQVVQRADGRVPVVAAGGFGETLGQKVESAKRLADAGVSAVVLVVNQIAAEDESQSAWRERAEQFLEQTPGMPLGLYECPVPYHRLLSRDLLMWAAGTGRFLWMKDTCCEIEEERAKIEACRRTPLRWCNAHAPTLLASLQIGGQGYSGIAANLYPELFSWLCANARNHPQRAAQLQNRLTLLDLAIRQRYPHSAKAFLRRRGVPIEGFCRTAGWSRSSEEELLFHDALLSEVDGLRDLIGL